MYIEGFCNTRRIQKKSGYLSPREYLKKNLSRQEKCVQVIDISPLSMNTKYDIEKGNYIFKIYPENCESFIYIIARKIKCNVINQNPFDFMGNKK